MSFSSRARIVLLGGSDTASTEAELVAELEWDPAHIASESPLLFSLSLAHLTSRGYVVDNALSYFAMRPLSEVLPKASADLRNAAIPFADAAIAFVHCRSEGRDGNIDMLRTSASDLVASAPFSATVQTLAVRP